MFLVAPRSNNEYTKEFSQFTITARGASNADRSKARFSTMNPRRVGRFQLFDDALTEFNVDCVNTISQSDDIAKTEIQVMWVAPPSGSGCIALSAVVYENQNSWFADDGQLLKIICEGEPTQDQVDNECCACDEAKYQVKSRRTV